MAPKADKLLPLRPPAEENASQSSRATRSTTKKQPPAGEVAPSATVKQQGEGTRKPLRSKAPSPPPDFGLTKPPKQKGGILATASRAVEKARRTIKSTDSTTGIDKEPVKVRESL